MLRARTVRPTIRFTVPVSNKWSWIFGILTAAAFVLAGVFFVVTQQLTGRDWAVLTIGALVGATVAALVATFLFHADSRARRLASDIALAAAAASSEQARLDQETSSRLELERVAVEADQERCARQAAAELALAERRTALLSALPTRKERLDELQDEVMQLRIEIATAKGSHQAGMAQAKDAARYGFNDMAYENLAAAKTWDIARERLEEKIVDRERERDRLSSLSDKDYLEEQRESRGLG